MADISELSVASIGPWGVHYARCYPCQAGAHFDPPRWHTWADDSDVEHAKATGQPDPSQSRCGCHCAEADRSTATGQPEFPEPDDDDLAYYLDLCDICDKPMSMCGDDLGCNCARCPTCGQPYSPSVAGSGLPCDDCDDPIDLDEPWDDDDPDETPLIVDLTAPADPAVPSTQGANNG